MVQAPECDTSPGSKSWIFSGSRVRKCLNPALNTDVSTTCGAGLGVGSSGGWDSTELMGMWDRAEAWGGRGGTFQGNYCVAPMEISSQIPIHGLLLWWLGQSHWI